MRSFTVLCLFGDKKSPFTLWLSDPAADAHPLEQQAAWLWRERGGLIRLDERLDALPGLKAGDSARAACAARLWLPVSPGPAFR